ncbi:MAG: hypothetical protein JSS89_13270 [Bacteroidetes bacterium]|nr:hypothetical protein [Bacteroidota bacterium]
MATSRQYDIATANPVLTNVVRGYGNNSFVADQILPIVEVDSEVGTYRDFGADRFKIYDTVRALRADSNRVPAASQRRLPYNLDEHDLEEPIDYREQASDMKRQANAANRVAELLTLARESRVATLVQASGTYAGGHSSALSGTNRFSHDSSDPAALIASAKATVASKIGADPNLLVLSHDVYLRLLVHPAIKELIKYAGIGVPTIESLKTIFDVEKIIVGKGVYQAQGATSFTKLFSNTCALLFVNPSTVPDEENPSFGYTLRKKGMPTADVYSGPGGKVTLVRSTDINKSIVMGNTSGFLYTSVLS